MGSKEPAGIGEEGEKPYYSTSEARRVLDISRQRIHQLLNDGLLRGYQDERTGRWYIERDSVLSYARSRAAIHYQPRLHALEAEVRELLRRLGAAESRIAVLDGIRREGDRERDLLREELGLIRRELSEVRREILRLGEHIRHAL